MKKSGVILLFAIAAFAFIGCSDDEATSLRWKNKSTDADAYAGIMWANDVGQANQTWDGVPDSTSPEPFTAHKEVTLLAGKGEALGAGGAPANVEFELDPSDPDQAGVDQDGSFNVVLKKNADATLVITAAKKK